MFHNPSDDLAGRDRWRRCVQFKYSRNWGGASPLEPTDLAVGSESYRAFIVAAVKRRAVDICGAGNVIDVPVRFHPNGRLQSVEIKCK